MPTTSAFVAKPIPEQFRVGKRPEIHAALIEKANEDGVVYCTYSELADFSGATPDQARHALAWLQAQGLITHEPGNRGRKGIVVLVAEGQAS